MRIVFAFILIAAGVAGVGLYRGWFHLTSDRAADKSNVTLTVDKDKIHEDKQKVVDQTRDVTDHAKEKVATPTGK